MTQWLPKSPVIRDEFSSAKNGTEVFTVLESRTRSLDPKLRGAQLEGSQKILRQACSVLDSGHPELAVLGFRASIESAGYAALTRVRMRHGGYREDLPLTVGGRVRRVEFSEILQGMRDRKLDAKLAEAASIVQLHGNAVAHETSRIDQKSDQVRREFLEKRGSPVSEDDDVILVPLDVLSAQAALEDARTAARILLLISRVMSRAPQSGDDRQKAVPIKKERS